MSYVPVLDLGYADQDIRYSLGDDKSFTVTYKNKTTGLPVDLTGCTFTAGVISPAISFTVFNSVPATGVITVNIYGSSVSALQLNGKYKWYMRYTYGGRSMKHMQGNLYTV